MKLIICALVLVVASVPVELAAVNNLDNLLDTCLNPRRDEAVLVLSSEITACGNIWSEAIHPVCIDIAREIVSTIIQFGVDCVKGLPINGLTDQIITNIVAQTKSDVNYYIQTADQACINNAPDIDTAVQCFISAVQIYAQSVVDAVKIRAHGYGLTA